MLPMFNLKNEYNLALQDEKEMSRISGEMTLYYAYDETGLEATYNMAEALKELGCTPTIRQGPVAHNLYGKCFQLKTGLLSAGLMDVVKDTLELNEFTCEYTAFQNFDSTIYSLSDADEQPSQLAQQLMAMKRTKPAPGQPA